MVESLHKWVQCAKEECTFETTWCTNINDQIVVDDVLPLLVTEVNTGELFRQQILEIYQNIFGRLGEYLSESVANTLGKCTAAPDDDHRDALTNSNTTCDTTKQTYARTTSKAKFNSTILMSCVFALFSCAILFFGNFKTFHFHLSIVRVGSCIVGLLMSALVYIGSLHLYWSSIGNPVQTDADLQMTWRALYLIASYMCLHGGLLVLVPKVGGDGGDGGVDKSKDQSASTDQDGVCSACGSTTCCRRGSCCFKSMSFIHAFKEQFWDASGSYFPLKLMLMEMIEIIIQLNSLASGATKSQVNNVVLSALIIAANLILLPLVIVLGPKCTNASSATSSDVSIAAVMMVEVLFDKLYVGVGVLFRYDTLIQRNMEFTDGLAVHLALLLPALMTALDVQDALVLAEHMEATPTLERSSSFTRVAGKVDNVAHSSVVLMIGKGGLASSILIGIALATYALIVSTTTRAECEQRIGTIASCASEKYYFTNGFFEHTDCAFEQVTSFKCEPGTCTADLSWGSKSVLCNLSLMFSFHLFVLLLFSKRILLLL